MEKNTKICTLCNVEYPIQDFYLKRGKPRASCKHCHKKLYQKLYKEDKPKYNKMNKRWRDANPEMEWSRALRSKYKITAVEWKELFNSQNGLCAICKTPNLSKKRFHTDHDHNTGKVCGLLCSNCNMGLGGFKESITLLQSAISYIERTQKTQK